MIEFVFDRVEYIVKKGENAGDQHFLFFPQCFLPIQRQILSFVQRTIFRLQMLSIKASLLFCHLVDISVRALSADIGLQLVLCREGPSRALYYHKLFDENCKMEIYVHCSYTK